MIGASAAMAQGAPYDQRVANGCAGMGLNPSEAPFVFCEMSLRDSAASVERARTIGLARRECRGYHVGTAAFANGVLDRQERAENRQRFTPTSTASEDHFHTYQRGDEITSVRRACAQVGLAPGSSGYETCVGDLDMTIDDANRVGTD
ncbi:MAG: hypothetical protein WBF10_10900 [Methylovirgula sp.]